MILHGNQVLSSSDFIRSSNRALIVKYSCLNVKKNSTTKQNFAIIFLSNFYRTTPLKTCNLLKTGKNMFLSFVTLY